MRLISKDEGDIGLNSPSVQFGARVTQVVSCRVAPKAAPGSTEHMDEAQVDTVKLFADGLTLVYHEARHVRFLIKAGHVSATGWEHVVSMPRDRVKAWRELQSVRQGARCSSTAREAARLFEERLGHTLEDLQLLYENPNWKDADAIGGHAWRRVTALVSALGDAIDQKDSTEIGRSCDGLLQARHNNGVLREKIRELDRTVGVTTDGWWHKAHED